ncbi:PKS_ER domain-containing protein [Trichoderma simmonsii]|uniref:PKS_ER domain-containing protein n=1 Tax=Trichoderma simmonsii TaxID=1491479 RepID=A0A8G0L8L8_9HYPO|nr:PKS_ER domain-containing protein [Trichoderma simmonsii]
MAQNTFKQWVLRDANGVESLHLSSATIPSTIGDYDVLVNLHFASLNYRDILIAQGKNPFPLKKDVVPVSDGAGVVVSVGPKVTAFSAGDRVAPTFMRDHIAGPITPAAVLSSLGAVVDGTLREYGVYPEHSLVRIADNLSLLEASSLPCAGVTAWTSLYGDRYLQPGDVVLTQGTSGVSLFALQLVVAAGAVVIATTSSAEKIQLLKGLGATHVLNYSEDKNWGETAKSLTRDGAGVDIVVEVGGASSVRQSLKAVRMGGIISLVGHLDSSEPLDPPFNPVEVLASQATIRAIGAGNRQDFVALMRAIDANHIKPVIDKKVFKMDEAREAYQHMLDRKHLGKVVIDLRGSQKLTD